MWKLVSVLSMNVAEVQLFLEDDYEPFAVTSDYRSERIWLRKKVDAFYSESESVKGTGRRPTGKHKEQTGG